MSRKKNFSNVRIVQRTETLDIKSIISVLNKSFDNIDNSLQNLEESLNRFIAANRSSIVEDTLGSLVETSERQTEVAEETNTILNDIRRDIESLGETKRSDTKDSVDGRMTEHTNSVIAAVSNNTQVLRDIKAELVGSRVRQERLAEEDRIESLDESKKHLQVLERIEDLLKGKKTGPQRDRATNREGLPSWLGTVALFPFKLLVGIFRALPLIGKILAPVAKIIGKVLKGGLVGLVKRVILPINAIFSLFEGIADFFDTSGIAEKLGKEESMVTTLDRTLNGLTGFVSRFIGNLIDPIFKFFGINFSIEEFLDGGFAVAQRWISDSVEKVASSETAMQIASTVWDLLTDLVKKSVDFILTPIIGLFGFTGSAWDFITGGMDSVSSVVDKVASTNLVGSVTNIWDSMITSVKDSVTSIVDSIVFSVKDTSDAILDWIKTRSWIPDWVTESLPETDRAKRRTEQLEQDRLVARKNTAINELPRAREEVKNTEARMNVELEEAARRRDAGIAKSRKADERQRYEEEYQKSVAEIVGRYDKEYTAVKERVSTLESDAKLEIPGQPSNSGSNSSGGDSSATSTAVASGPGSNAPEMAQVQPPVVLQRQGDMKTSQAGLDFIKQRESFRSEAYQDSGGIWTIGYGTTFIDGKPVQPGMKITEQEALALKAKDIEKFENVVNKSVKVALSQNEFDALVSLAYNIGGGAFARSTLVRKLNAGDRAGATEEFKKWNKVEGKEVRGLTNRRNMESEMFAGTQTQGSPASSQTTQQPSGQQGGQSGQVTPQPAQQITPQNTAIASASPVAASGTELVADQRTQSATTKEIANSPIQAQIINNNSNQTSSDDLKVALRNDEPSFKKIIERLAMSSMGVLTSPIMTA